MNTEPIEPTSAPSKDVDLPEALLPGVPPHCMGKPLKAANTLLPLDSPLIRYDKGVVSSRKIDGNRLLVIRGRTYSSSMKEQRNDDVRRLLAPLLQLSIDEDMVFDGELFDPDQTHHAATSGLINSYDTPLTPTTALYVFDGAPFLAWEERCLDFPFRSRIPLYTSAVHGLAHPRIIPMEQRPVANAEEAITLFNRDVADGFEGSMLRCLDIWQEGSRNRGGWYKHGRATNNEAIMWKAKVYVTVDARITEVLQRRLLRDDWPREYDQWGHLKRPLEKDAYTFTDMVGGFVVEYQDESTGQPTRCEIGFRKGFDFEWRRAAWHSYVANPSSLIGKHVEFMLMPHGAKPGGLARVGGLVRFRPDLD